MTKRRICYISSPRYLQICDKHPKTQNRASLVHALIKAYHLVDDMVDVIKPAKASENDLLNYHTNDYVQCLKNIQDKFTKEEYNNDTNLEDLLDMDEWEEEFSISSYGLGYDCALFPQIFDYVKFVLGGTLDAVNEIVQEKVEIAINFNGGWHHSHAGVAAGFCYVNDIVIGILHLLRKFKRVLYIDLDIHHGDGVEEAFEHSAKVYTFSLHKFSPGFFPGTGNLLQYGVGAGKNYSLNVPLKDGTTDETFYFLFSSIFNKLISAYNPQTIVVQCGADALAHDPMGTFNLTSKAFCQCIRDIVSVKKPLIILGGGGYNLPNTARCWTQIMATVLGRDLCPDIPYHDNINYYGPDYSLNITKSNRKDENTEQEISEIIATCISKIQNINNLANTS